MRANGGCEEIRHGAKLEHAPGVGFWVRMAHNHRALVGDESDDVADRGSEGKNLKISGEHLFFFFLKRKISVNQLEYTYWKKSYIKEKVNKKILLLLGHAVCSTPCLKWPTMALPCLFRPCMRWPCQQRPYQLRPCQWSPWPLAQYWSHFGIVISLAYY